MRIINSALRRTIYYFRQLQSYYWRYKCEFGSYLSLGQLLADHSTRFNAPVRVDGAGRVCIRANVSLGDRGAAMLGNGEILFQARTQKSMVFIGSNCHFNNNVSIVALQKVVMGVNCLVGDGVCIYDADFHEIEPDKRYNGTGLCATVSIGNNVWLGSRAMVLKGVSIGENSIIAPMSVVTKDIPANVIAAGIPAKTIRNFD